MDGVDQFPREQGAGNIPTLQRRLIGDRCRCTYTTENNWVATCRPRVIISINLPPARLWGGLQPQIEAGQRSTEHR